MKAFGIVILSHILSRISSPESGRAMARTMVGISVFTVSWISSKGPAICTECNKPEISRQRFNIQSVQWHNELFLQWIILMTLCQMEKLLQCKQLSHNCLQNLHFSSPASDFRHLTSLVYPPILITDTFLICF
jgi:hypothetical protein